MAKLRKLLKDLEREQVKQMAKAHQKLDQLAQKDISSTSQASVPTMGAIGYLESCFAVKNGTPRQGSICPTSKAKLRILWGTNARHTLEGLEKFSHVWLIFLFHANDNAAVKAKVRPPQLDGEKLGLFATRTPHRPNPIGLSQIGRAHV